MAYCKLFNELEKQLAGSVLQNGCSEKFKIHENKRSSILFFILLTKQKHFIKDVFFGIF